MDPRLVIELSAIEETPFHAQLKSHCLQLVRNSRSYMSTFYSTWEDRHKTYRSFRTDDKDDKKAKEEGRPAKQVIPMTYAKVQTFVAFGTAVMTQRQRLFELEPQGVEDEDYKELCEKILDFDVKSNKFTRLLRQHLTDIGKFGMGVIKHSWTTDYVYVPVTTNGTENSIFGIKWKGKDKTEIKRLVRHQGNSVRCVSPFDFLPDTRYPLSDLHKGEFCGDESDMSRNDLLRMEAEMTVAGIRHVSSMEVTNNYASKKYMRRSRINFDNPDKTSNIVRVTELQIKITPSEFLLTDGKALGSEKTPTMYLVWIANDQRIIRCEPMGYLHGEFTYEVGQYDEDSQDFVNQSLADVLDRLQETCDWFMNARVESVTRTIDNQLVVDPMGIDMSTIVNRSRVILMKPGASRTGVDRYVKQLQVQDVTARHMDDISQLTTIMQAVSGVNENAMGQYHTGRRSATEARVVAQGAASRLKLIIESIWDASIMPTGAKMLLNLRQGLTAENVVKIGGQQYATKPEVVQRFTSTPEELAMQTDFFVYDGTLQSEKAYLAQSLMELFNTVTTLGAQGLIELEISPKLLLQKVYELLGVGSLEQFDLQRDPQTLQRAVQQVVQQAVQQYAEQSANAIPITAGNESSAVA